jgi:hypothetical protein
MIYAAFCKNNHQQRKQSAMNILFNRLRKNTVGNAGEPVDTFLSQKLVKLLTEFIRDQKGNIRAEDLICAAATIVGERCIDAAGELSLRDHEFIPGSRVLSSKVNELICSMVVGELRRKLDAKMYVDADFPVLNEVFKYFADHINDPDDWGRTPLTVEREHWPLMHPLRVGYETRPFIDAILDLIQEDKARCLRVTVESLAEIIKNVEPVIDHRLTLTLAIETINAMAKTAPMTEKMMRNVSRIH